jgi:hypothetical protein
MKPLGDAVSSFPQPSSLEPQNQLLGRSLSGESTLSRPEHPTNTTPPATKKLPASQLGLYLVAFLRELEGLQEAVDLSMLVASAARTERRDALTKFKAENCAVEKGPDVTRVSVPIAHYNRFKKLVRQEDRFNAAVALVPRAFFVAMVSQYDAFLGEIIRTIFRLQPDKLRSSERTLTASQILDLSSADSVVEYFIDREVETVLRGSHTEQFEWLERKLDTTLRKDLEVWPKFVELTQRRNLFVHTGGVVSDQYLAACSSVGFEHPTTISKGTQLGVSQSYFRSAHDTIAEIAIKLSQVLWRRLAKDDIESADSNLIEVTFDLLNEDRFRLAAATLAFATGTVKRHASDRNKRILIINHAQSHKWLGEESECSRILSTCDWTACDDTFTACHLALTDKHDGVISMLSKPGFTDGFPKSHFRDWPVFRELRKDPRFADAFAKAYKEPLDPLTTESAAADPAQAEVPQAPTS